MSESTSQLPAVTAVQRQIIDRLAAGERLSAGVIGNYRWRLDNGKPAKGRAVNIDTLCSMKRKGLVCFVNEAKKLGDVDIEVRVIKLVKQQSADPGAAVQNQSAGISP